MPKFTAFTAAQLEAAIADLSGKSTARAARHLVRAKNALAKLQSTVAVPAVAVIPEGITELEFKLLKSFETYDTLEGTQSDCGVSWTDAKELAEATGLAINTVKGVMGSLAKKGLIEIDDETNGRKTPICCLTPEGAVFAHA